MVTLHRLPSCKSDLFLKNGVKEPKALGGTFYYLPVNHTGEVTRWPIQVVKTHSTLHIFLLTLKIVGSRIMKILGQHKKCPEICRNVSFPGKRNMDHNSIS